MRVIFMLAQTVLLQTVVIICDACCSNDFVWSIERFIYWLIFLTRSLAMHIAHLHSTYCTS